MLAIASMLYGGIQIERSEVMRGKDRNLRSYYKLFREVIKLLSGLVNTADAEDNESGLGHILIVVSMRSHLHYVGLTELSIEHTEGLATGRLRMTAAGR